MVFSGCVAMVFSGCVAIGFSDCDCVAMVFSGCVTMVLVVMLLSGWVATHTVKYACIPPSFPSPFLPFVYLSLQHYGGGERDNLTYYFNWTLAKLDHLGLGRSHFTVTNTYYKNQFIHFSWNCKLY